MEFFPERLATAKWLDRLEIRGREHLELAQRQKRPVVLAFCHFGPYFLIRFWLRAIGFPASALIQGFSQNRQAMKRRKDRASPFPEIPTAFYHEDQLRETIAFVNSGYPLLVAIDVLTGKQMEVPVDADWRCGMATGAIRLAMRTNAALMSCSIVDVGPWQFQITFGPSVPAEVIAAGDVPSAGKHLLDTFLPELRAHPEQASERLIKLFQRVKR